MTKKNTCNGFGSRPHEYRRIHNTQAPHPIPVHTRVPHSSVPLHSTQSHDEWAAGMN